MDYSIRIQLIKAINNFLELQGVLVLLNSEFDEIMEFVRKGETVNAIKALRNHTRRSLTPVIAIGPCSFVAHNNTLFSFIANNNEFSSLVSDSRTLGLKEAKDIIDVLRSLSSVGEECVRPD